MRALLTLMLIPLALVSCTKMPTNPDQPPDSGIASVWHSSDRGMPESPDYLEPNTIYLSPGTTTASPNTDVKVEIKVFQIAGDIAGVHLELDLAPGITFSGQIDTSGSAGILSREGGTTLGWADVIGTTLTIDLMRVGPATDSTSSSGAVASLHFSATSSGHINIRSVRVLDSSYGEISGLNYRHGWIELSGD